MAIRLVESRPTHGDLHDAVRDLEKSFGMPWEHFVRVQEREEHAIFDRFYPPALPVGPGGEA